MKRTITLRAASEALPHGGGIAPGTSPYPSQNTPSKTLYEIWNAGPVDGEYGFFWDESGTYPALAVGFEQGPTLARFNKLTITTGFDYAKRKPNNFFFPPDNAHGPRGTIRFRKRDQTTWLSGTGDATYTVLDSDPYFVNMNLSSGYALKTLTWEMLAHPEGGPFTLDDINGLAIGVEFAWADGPNGHPFELTGGFHRIRCPYLTVELEVEDLGGFVDNVRRASSIGLRLMRRARDVIKPATFAEHAAEDVMVRAYLSHAKGGAVGGGGWGPRRLERVPALVIHRTILPEAFRVEDEMLDLRSFVCLGWAAYRIDGPWSTELQGLALIDKGLGFTHTRAQDGWSPRPGDANLMRVLEGYPNLSFHGLAAQGGGDIAVALQNYDLMQSGWTTVLSSGSFTATADTTVTMVEEQGYLSSARLEYGGGGGQGGRERSLGPFPFASGYRLHVRVVVKNTSVPDPETQNAEVLLRRAGGGLPASEYWDEVARDWTTVVTPLPIPSAAPFGELILDAVPCDAALATSDPDYSIAVGRFSSDLSSVTFHGALVDVQHSDDTVAGARTPIVTLDATITREPDVHRMEHVWGRELWIHERGVVVAEARPFWRAEDLPHDAVKPLVHAQHAPDTWQALQFVAQTSGPDRIRFESAISGEGTFQLDCPIEGIDLTRAHVLRAWARWLGPEGWKEYGPYSVEVGYAVFLEADGTLVGQGSVVGRLSSETPVPHARDWVGIGCDEEDRAFDGYIRLWETRLNPIHRLQALWKV